MLVMGERVPEFWRVLGFQSSGFLVRVLKFGVQEFEYAQTAREVSSKAVKN
jgi:hypothetical protein